MKKTLLSIALLLMLVVCLLAFPATAAEAEEVEATHSHCVCGGTLTDQAKTAGGHSCDTGVAWEAWGDTDAEKTKLPTSGSYYLVDDITVACGSSVPTGASIVTTGKTLNLCLNGHSITTQARTFDVKVGAFLNITDCKGSGIVNGNTEKRTETTAVCFIRGGGTLNIYGGTLNAANKATMTGAGGTIYISNSTADGKGVLNMYGGTITNGRAKDSGNIYLDGILNMYGGTISNGTATNNGGNINASTGTLNLVGGTITGGTAVKGGNIRANVELVLGAGTISNGKATDGGNLYTNDSKNVTLNGTIFIGGEATGNGGSLNLGGTFYLRQGASITGGKADGDGGNIYARRSVNLESGTVSNGYAGGDGGNVYCFRYDTKTSGNVVTTNTSVPTVKVAGATVSGGEAAGKGGNIYGSCSVTVTTGTISGGKAADGGNIYMMSSDQVATEKDAAGNVVSTTTTTVANKLTISGGQITSGSAANGGNIYMKDCTLAMTAGTVSKGTATVNGGNLYTTGDTGSLSIAGATFSDGTASNGGTKTACYGGNFYLNSKTVTITNTTISGGKATHGGNIEATAAAKTLKITDCQISGGDATLCDGPSKDVGNGGNIHCANGSNTTLTDCTLTGGKGYRGGSISAFAHVTLNNCTVSGGYSKVAGGNIFSYNYGKVTVDSASTIADGISEKDGGNILVASTGEAIFNGTTISGGTAATIGGSIEVESSGSVCTLNGVKLSGGQAAQGNAIGIKTQATVKISDSEISADGAVIYVLEKSNLELTDSTVNNIGTEGAAVRNCGNLTLAGTLNFPGQGVDVLLDIHNGAGAAINVAALTGQSTPITVTRWVDDDVVLDPGLIATGATETQAAMLKSYTPGYGIRFADGGLYIAESVVQGMDGKNVVSGYNTLNEALAAQDAKAQYFRMNEDLDGQTISTDAIVDLGGNHLTNVIVEKDVTLQLMDSANDNYGETCGTLSGMVEGSVQTFVTLGGKHYLTVAESGIYSAHRFDVQLTHTNLRPATNAIGFKSKLSGDKTVMQYVTVYGFNFWVTEDNVVTASKTEGFGSVMTLRLQNILASGGGETRINGNVFITLTVDGESYTITGKDRWTSMKTTVETVNKMLADDRAAFTKTQVTAMQNMLSKYEETKKWSIDAIMNWIPAADHLVKDLAADSMVLLKNENNTLPLTKNTKINLFGYNATDLGFLLTGGGSGSTRTAAEKNVSLLQAFQQAGVAVNMDLYNQYAAWDTLDLDSNSTTDAPQCILTNPGEDFYTDELMEQAKSYSNTAVVVIGRWGRENGAVQDGGVSHYEIPYIQVKSGMPTDTSRTYLQISTEEELMLRKVTENFDNVIVLLNLCNTMELGFLDDAGIDAAMFIGTPGQSGACAIPRLLFGDITPSGKLADVYPYNHKADPTWANACVERSNSSNRYITYQEGIYYGYRWYETAFADGIKITVNGYEQDFSTEEGYRQIVQYPFGYGLSYTTFKWELVEAPSAPVTQSTDAFTVKVKVTNTGSVAGKDVVQLYIGAPYTPGGIEKAAVTLVDFAKTDTLKPGQSQILTLSFTAYDLAAYDCYDANKNGFAGYELEQGIYSLKLMTDAHSARLTFELQVSQGLQFAVDPVTGQTVENRFTGSDAYGSPIDGGVKYMTRADFAGTFPGAQVAGTKTVTVKPSYTGELKTVRYGQDNGLYLVTREDGSKATQEDLTGESDNVLIWNKDLLLQLQDYDSEVWDVFLNQITKEETKAIIKDGGFKINATKTLGVFETEESDGPSGMSRVDAADRTAWPAQSLTACSWNRSLLYNMGRAMGMEAKKADIQGWYAPGANLHRNPYNARNFEYYSEDPVLTGKLAASTISGAKQEGLICFLKHFAVSEAGKNPSLVNTWLTEQSLREVYLKAFEIAVKDGDTNAVMSAFNNIGDVYCGHNQALLQNVLRDEWGFRGQVITDWWGEYMKLNECILAGNDKMLLRRETTQEVDLSNDSSEISNAARLSVKNIIYSLVDSCVAGGLYEKPVGDRDVQDATDEGGAGGET